jgi:hypothetical protein
VDSVELAMLDVEVVIVGKKKVTLKVAVPRRLAATTLALAQVTWT